MNNTELKTIMPDYMKSFKCTASLCEDCCCEGWKDIYFDCITFEKYKNINDPQIMEILKKNIISIEHNETFSGKFDLLKNSASCPFLTKDNLCLMQARMGEQYLPFICSTYPRISNLVNSILEKSAAMSCPEACRIALLKPEGIEFTEIEEPDNTRSYITSIIEVDNPLSSSPLNRYFHKLRSFSIQIIKNRNYSIQDRVLILGLFSRDAALYHENNMIDKIPQLIETYSKKIDVKSFGDILAELPTDYISQFVMLINFISGKIFNGIANYRFLECMKDFLRGIEYNPEFGLGKITRNYSKAYEDYYSPFMSDHEYIFENYIVNYIFQNIFPFSSDRTIFDLYTLLALHYSLIKMFLIGMSRFHKGLTKELVIKLIQSFTKTIDHDTAFLKLMHNTLIDSKYNTINYMSMLVKN